MLSHALTIVINELISHLKLYVPPPPPVDPPVQLGNLSDGFSSGQGNSQNNVPRNILNISVVNIKEEKSLKNLPNYVRDDTNLRVLYENPPVFLNFFILITATHTIYSNALVALSRAIRFFQFRNVFTPDNVAPSSIKTNAPQVELDQLESFKLIFDLYSPTMEELNHLWGTLGGKQYPSVLYLMRMLDLKFKGVQSEGKLITEVVSDYSMKNLTPSEYE